MAKANGRNKKPPAAKRQQKSKCPSPNGSNDNSNEHVAKGKTKDAAKSTDASSESSPKRKYTRGKKVSVSGWRSSDNTSFDLFLYNNGYIYRQIT